jgi:hypothetical protein
MKKTFTMTKLLVRNGHDASESKNGPLTRRYAKWLRENGYVQRQMRVEGVATRVWGKLEDVEALATRIVANPQLPD